MSALVGEEEPETTGAAAGTAVATADTSRLTRPFLIKCEITLAAASAVYVAEVAELSPMKSLRESVRGSM